eukprot:11172725-Lingulodinium_polyedra.AAC.1
MSHAFEGLLLVCQCDRRRAAQVGRGPARSPATPAKLLDCVGGWAQYSVAYFRRDVVCCGFSALLVQVP